MKQIKTIILYASKHGAAAELAKRIAAQAGGTAYDLKQGGVPSVSDYDCVILGSSVYAGTILKEMKEFVQQNASALNGKRVGIFFSGISTSEDSMNTYLANNYPAELTAQAKAKASLGGVFDPAKAGFFEKIIMRIILKKPGYVSTIDESKLKEFVSAITA